MGENSQSSHVVKITSLDQIASHKNEYQDLIKQAINNEKEGKKVAMKTTSEYEVPEELKLMFNENPDLKIAFEKLTPGRQSGYLLHFSAPKQSKTRFARIEKFNPNILQGKGFQE